MSLHHQLSMIEKNAPNLELDDSRYCLPDCFTLYLIRWEPCTLTFFALQSQQIRCDFLYPISGRALRNREQALQTILPHAPERSIR